MYGYYIFILRKKILVSHQQLYVYLRNRVTVLSDKYANLIKEKENAENMVRRMSRNVRNKESEISSLTAQLKQ